MFLHVAGSVTTAPSDPRTKRLVEIFRFQIRILGKDWGPIIIRGEPF